ncbi:MAG TPA: histidine phosphatase family protein [Steroidobacteraceae bacterium]|nr:histidine phosphatase family protein [Steroidobacteraceae bacterium]
MELLIVRHAMAFERNARRWPDDGARPLSPRGVARARKAAAGLKQLVRVPGRVLTSPLVRARQTAAILSEVAGWPQARECPELAPGVAPEALLAALRRLPGSRMALIGHEPALSRLLAAALPGAVRGEVFRLRKMGAALISFAGAARPGGARLEWLVPAKLLRAAR